MNSVNIYNIKTAGIRDEDGNTEGDKPEILPVEESSPSAGVEQIKRN